MVLGITKSFRAAPLLLEGLPALLTLLEDFCNLLTVTGAGAGLVGGGAVTCGTGDDPPKHISLNLS